MKNSWLHSKRELFVWGEGNCGQLGIGNTKGTEAPQNVFLSVQRKNNVTQVAFGLTSCAVVLEKKDLFLWGCSSSGTFQATPKQFAVSLRVTHVSCGAFHTAVLDERGACFVWGENDSGQLGLGDTAFRNSPEELRIEGTTISAISCGYWHTMASTSKAYVSQYQEIIMEANGVVYTWGNNNHGQLGLGDLYNRNLPQPVPGLPLGNIVSAACEVANNSAVLFDSGSLFVWGANNFGQLGLGDTTNRESPQQILLQQVEAKALVCQYSHSAIITEGGQAFVWGRNEDGDLGISEDSAVCIPTELWFEGKAKIVSISFGMCHGAACLDNGDLIKWGRDIHGQPQRPTCEQRFESKYKPVEVVCGPFCSAALVGPKIPNWRILKPFFVGWLKDRGCSFHYSKGVPAIILQYILECALDCEFPSPLKPAIENGNGIKREI